MEIGPLIYDFWAYSCQFRKFFKILSSLLLKNFKIYFL